MTVPKPPAATTATMPEPSELAGRASRGAGALRVASWLIAVLLLLGAATAAVNNLSYTGMWWDETTCFWGSQGLAKYVRPFAPPGGLREVVVLNRYESLDPGGFTVLLHFWTRAGTGLAWLRSLPFAFFLLGAACLGLLGWRLTGSSGAALAAAAVPMLYPAALYFAFEIRAFSMEMAGVAVGALGLVMAMERPSTARLALLGVVCAAFLSSRYSYALFAAGLCLAAFTGLVRHGIGVVAATRRMLALVAPLAAAGAGIVAVTLRHQVWPEMHGGALGLTSPVYTRAAVLGEGTGGTGLLATNLVSAAALPITVAIAFFLLLRRYFNRALAPRGGGERPGDRLGLISSLYVLVLAVQGISVIVSLLGWYPWDIDSRWSAYLVMVSAVAAVALGSDAVLLCRLALDRWVLGSAVRSAIACLGVVPVLVLAVVAIDRATGHVQLMETSHRTNVAPQIDRLPIATLEPRSVFVAFYEVPVLRYLYEHGPYKDRAEYPRVYRFEKGSEWRAKLPIDARREGLRYLVSALPAEDVAARFPAVPVARVGPAGSRLRAFVANSAGEVSP